jgi:hypothetical protein
MFAGNVSHGRKKDSSLIVTLAATAVVDTYLDKIQPARYAKPSFIDFACFAYFAGRSSYGDTKDH